MFEILGLLLGLAIVGAVICVLGLLLIPFYLLFRLFGFAVKATFGGILLVLAGILILPIALLVGAVLLVKLILIGLPLLILGLLVWGLVALLRPATT